METSCYLFHLQQFSTEVFWQNNFITSQAHFFKKWLPLSKFCNDKFAYLTNSKNSCMWAGRRWEGEEQRSEFEREWSLGSDIMCFCSSLYGDSFLITTVGLYGFILHYLDHSHLKHWGQCFFTGFQASCGLGEIPATLRLFCFPSWHFLPFQDWILINPYLMILDIIQTIFFFYKTINDSFNS